jgi:hypothetical protein
VARASLKLDTHSIDIFIRKIAAIGGGAPAYLDAVTERCMNFDLYPRWVEQISMNDHTLEQLAALGHPYSKRYSKDSFVHPDDVVHIQDGNLLGSSSILKAAKGWLLVNTSPEYVWLRYGKGRMRMRDPGGAAIQNALPAIRDRFRREVKNAIVEVIGH